MKKQIHILIIDASDGQTTSAHSTEGGLNARLYASLKNRWDEVSWHDDVPDSPPEDVDEALGIFRDTVSQGGGVDTYYYVECEELEFLEVSELIEALKGLYRLIEGGNDSDIHLTMNPYARPQMRRAGKALNQVLGLKSSGTEFEKTLFEGKD